MRSEIPDAPPIYIPPFYRIYTFFCAIPLIPDETTDHTASLHHLSDDKVPTFKPSPIFISSETVPPLSPLTSPETFPESAQDSETFSPPLFSPSASFPSELPGQRLVTVRTSSTPFSTLLLNHTRCAPPLCMKKTYFLYEFPHYIILSYFPDSPNARAPPDPSFSAKAATWKQRSQSPPSRERHSPFPPILPQHTLTQYPQPPFHIKRTSNLYDTSTSSRTQG